MCDQSQKIGKAKEQKHVCSDPVYFIESYRIRMLKIFYQRLYKLVWRRHGRDLMVIGCTTIYAIGDAQLTMQSVPITTDVVGSNTAQGAVYNIM